MVKIIIENPGNRDLSLYEGAMRGQISFRRLEEELRATGNIRPSEVITSFDIDNEWVGFTCARKKKVIP